MKYWFTSLLLFSLYSINYAIQGDPDQLYRDAYKLEGDNQLYEAAKTYLEAADLYRAQKNYEFQAKVTERVGIIYHNAFHYQNSITFYRKTLHIRQEHFPDPEKEAQALYNIGIAYQHMGSYDSAIHYLGEASNTYVKDYYKAKCYFEIARVTRRLKDLDRTVKYYMQASELDLDAAMQANVFQNLGYAYMHFGDTVKAEHYFDKAMPLVMFNETLVNKAVIHRTRGEYKKALEYLTQAASQQDTSKITELVMFNYRQLADVHFLLDNKEESLLCHQIRGDMGDRLYKRQKELDQLYNHYQGQLMVARFEAEEERKAYQENLIIYGAIFMGIVIIIGLGLLTYQKRAKRLRKARESDLKTIDQRLTKLNNGQ
ncbi:MAG: tetratricopeptide repeat protein [Fulvivirga sp.]